MLLRWSDGKSYSHEFRPDADFERSLVNALIEFRRHRPHGRAELHVWVHPRRGGWHLPLISWTVDGGPARLPAVRDVTSPEALAASRAEINRWRGGYTLVLHDPRGEPDPPGSRPKPMSGTHVLRVGPGAWHGEQIEKGCIRSLSAHNAFRGMARRLVQSEPDGEQG